MTIGVLAESDSSRLLPNEPALSVSRTVHVARTGSTGEDEPAEHAVAPALTARMNKSERRAFIVGSLMM